MVRTHKPPEGIVGKLREAKIVLAQGGTMAAPCRCIDFVQWSYCR